MAALIKRGFTLDLLYSAELELMSPEYVFQEIASHEEEILKKSSLSKDDLSVFVDIIKSRIRIIPAEELKPFTSEAASISPDPDDTPYFALAMKLDCCIWSNEKALKKQSRVEVHSTEDLLKILRL